MPDGVQIPGGPSFAGWPQPPDVPCDPVGDGWRGPQGFPGPPGPPGPQGEAGGIAGAFGSSTFSRTDTGTVSSFPPVVTVNYDDQAVGGVPSTYVAAAFEVNAKSYPASVGNVIGVLAQLTSTGTGLFGNQDVGIASSVTKPGGAVSIPFGLWVPVRDTSGLDGDNVSKPTRGGIIGMELDFYCSGPDNPPTAANPKFGSRDMILLSGSSYLAPVWTANTAYALNAAVQPPAAPLWAATHAYALNALVRPSSPANLNTYVCVTAGTSGTTEPTWPLSTGTVTDGSAVWKWIGRASNGYTYVCTAAGTSGATSPAWPLSTGTVTDGTVTWTWGTTMAPQISRAIHINGRPNTGVTFGTALYTDATFYDAILELSGADLVDGGANDAAIRIGPNQPIDFSGNVTDPTQNNHTLRFINNDAGAHRLSYRDAVSELFSIHDGGPVLIGDGTTGAILQLNAAVATGRQVQFMTNNALRWSLITGIGAGTESGGNAGSNFTLMRYADDGSQLGSPLTANRATGVVTLAVAPVLTTLPINAANDAAAAAAGVVIGGEYRNGSIKMIRVA